MPLINTMPTQGLVTNIQNSSPLDEYYKTPNGKKFILYHTNWATYGRNFQVKDLPIDIIPEIAYAFFNVDAYGNIVSGDTWADFDKRFVDSSQSVLPVDNWNSNDTYYGNLGQFRKLKEAGKKFNLTLSIGGWSWSKYFSSAVNSSNRTNFINNIINILTKYNIFCGVSIDWEYFTNDGVNHGNAGNESRSQDCSNLIETIKLLKFRLSSLNKQHYKISVCCSADPTMIKFSDLFNVCQVADELHVMTYDFSDYNFSKPISSHHTNLKKCEYSNFSVEETIDALLRTGIQSTKIFIGAAFYSRGFGGTDGPGKPATQPSTDKSWEAGIVDYKSLPLPGSVEYWDSKCMAPFSYDNTKKIYNSYDNVNSIYYKSRYVLEKNLGGILVWESSGDKPVNDPRSLIAALDRYLIKENKTEPILPKIWGEAPVVKDPIISPPNPKEPVLIPFWEENKTYNIGDIVIHNGKFYKCRNKHTSNLGWLPNLTNGTLWTAIENQVVQPVPVPAPVVQPVPVVQPELPDKESENSCNCNCYDRIVNHLNKMKIKIKIDTSFDSDYDIVSNIIESYIGETISIEDKIHLH